MTYFLFGQQISGIKSKNCSCHISLFECFNLTERKRLKAKASEAHYVQISPNEKMNVFIYSYEQISLILFYFTKPGKTLTFHYSHITNWVIQFTESLCQLHFMLFSVRKTVSVELWLGLFCQGVLSRLSWFWQEICSFSQKYKQVHF